MYSLVISMCYEMNDIVDNKRMKSKEIDQMFDHFLAYIMKNFETELVILGSKIAIQTYKLDFDGTRLKHFEEFHKKFGKYIIAANKN
jgi:hypothetical protein